MRSLFLLPGRGLSTDLLSALNIANRRFTQSKNFEVYKEDIRSIFNLDPICNISFNHKLFLGGFIEGEGSVNVSMKRHNLSHHLLVY